MMLRIAVRVAVVTTTAVCFVGVYEMMAAHQWAVAIEGGVAAIMTLGLMWIAFTDRWPKG